MYTHIHFRTKHLTLPVLGVHVVVMATLSHTDVFTLTFATLQVTLTVPNLPTAQNYTCLFGDIETTASIEGDRVTCQPPTADAVTKQPHNHTWGTSLTQVSMSVANKPVATIVASVTTPF